MRKNTTLSFNGINFDLPVLTYALLENNNSSIKDLSDTIIKTNLPAWQICKEKKINVPTEWDHIDLIEVAPGQSSLKIYGGRLNAPKMQDLPIHPDKVLTREEADIIRSYCVNDLDTTILLYKKLIPQINLRISMSEMYGMDLRSKSDSGIATAVLKSELEKETGKKYYAPSLPNDYCFQYKDPEFLLFKTTQLQSLYERILEHRFTLHTNGRPELPDWLAKSKIEIGSSVYQMGIGGIHSTEKSQCIIAKPGKRIVDADATSFYPNIILGQSLYPDSIGEKFLKVYQSIVDRRINAKKSGDKTTADTLKIVINSSYGLLGNKYSMLYSPDLLLQTTITGQLSLLMLIERMEEAGVSVVSANTDGVILLYDDDQQVTVDTIAFNWMLDTTFELEYTEYKCVASRDVNSYLTVKPNGSLKRKGVFAEPGLAKNPDRIVIYDAVAEYVSKNTPIDQTIKSCSDITQFITVRKVTGGAQWQGEYLGKAVRFYKSNTVGDDVEINYVKNGNKVPNSAGCRPLMDLPDSFPTDIDYAYYIKEANDLLTEVGYARKTD
jgi:DNA polymerase elongation subunit (family B)